MQDPEGRAGAAAKRAEVTRPAGHGCCPWAHSLGLGREGSLRSLAHSCPDR